MDISIVVPAYNEEESLGELVAWINRVAKKENLSYEIIIIDDGSSDNTWNEITRLSQENESVRGIKFRRNYGKSAALNVGFEASEGDVVFTMDADLQDSPDEIPEMRRMILEEGYDLVSGWKKVRHDPLDKRLPSKLFNRVTRHISGIKLHDFNCGLKAYKKDVVKSIEVYGEMHRYIPLIAKEAGFKHIGEKVVTHYKRKFGVSKFGIERTIKGFLDLLTVVFATKFGKSPMHLFGALGTLMFFIGILATIWLGAKKLYYVYQGIPMQLITNNPYFYIALSGIIMGTQLFLAGFVAELVTRNSSERNKYQIAERLK
ncbi:MAG: glycosyltransferase family 2 protein [Bacteroidales bacterium]|jgi:glycosyltransferase involved in cell wall biosynthesis|nr:glycosyltransferase family 2 protein [Bacteroidales bacterium]MBP5420168.1 glycosyltransferase family 2 protein [Bacteroidales bacterium]MCR5697215.1 glycosyltransferase family 2 protein [Marinilabiliaceae bacterium]